jgi:hypothetical protein
MDLFFGVKYKIYYDKAYTPTEAFQFEEYL